MSHIIKTQHIAAATHTSAYSGNRNYLKGVLVDTRIIVSTDTYCASAYLGQYCDEYLQPFIIPNYADKLIAKIKREYIEVLLLDGRINIGGVVFKPICGTFPDYKRIFLKDNIYHKQQQFPKKLAIKFQNVAKALKANCKVPFLYATNSCGIFRVAIQGKESEFMGVIFESSGMKFNNFVCGNWITK